MNYSLRVAALGHDILTEDLAALLFLERYRDQLRFDYSRGAWLEWNGAVWRPDRTEHVFDLAREHVRALAEQSTERPSAKIKYARPNFAASVERYARADRGFATTSDFWDRDPMLLGTLGGTLDLRTGKSRAGDPGEGITRALAIVPAETADCPNWLRFLHEATGGDEGLIRFLQQWSGYCLTGCTTEHALVFIYGSGGNGKSVFTNTLAGILGDYAATAPMDTFTAAKGERHSTELAMLRGARLVTASETEEGRAWAESRIKQLTGGDPITARFMRRNFFTFWPTFKLTVIGNHRPSLRNVDDAMRRRLNFIPFTRKPSKPDPHLEEKLRAEWPGILRWMIDGCLDWQRNGLVRPRSVIAATDEYFSEQDVVGRWLEDCCDVDLQNSARRTSSGELFTSFSAYARDVGEPPGSSRSLSIVLRKRGFEPFRTDAVRGFVGIGVRPNDT